MTSPLLALLGRSLREDVHDKKTYQSRGGVSIFILFALFTVSIANSWGGAPGRSFFSSIVVMQTIAITLAGMTYFASAIAEEKEEQTLGLLRMTGLNPLSVLLGKSTSRLCGVLLLLVAQFPFTVMAVTFGGISLGQIVATYCTLAAYTFLLCNVALLGSVLMRHVAGASAFSAGIVILLLAGGPLLGSFPASWPTMQAAGQFLSDASVITRLGEILTTGFTGSPIGVQVGSSLALGVIFFLLAWAAFSRFCDRASTGAVSGGEIVRAPIGAWGRRPPRAGADALAWKDYHFMCGGRWGMRLRCVFYGAAVLAALVEALINPDWDHGIRAAAYSAVAFIFSLDIGGMAGRIFRIEIRDQTLSTLAVLPCSMREIAFRKVRALLWAAIPGAVAVVCLGAILLLSRYFIDGSQRAQVYMGSVLLWSNIPVLAFLTALFSLDLKYGSLPLAYVVTLYMSGTLAGAGGSGGSAVLLGACFISLLCTLYFRKEIAARLEAKASQD
jgi:ABC-type transport system involved in cytochrome c biogenesis permease component